MSTMTIDHPTVIVPGTDGAAPSEAMRTGANWAQRAASKISYYASKAWNGFLSGLRWLRDKAVSFYHWGKDQVVMPVARTTKSVVVSSATWVRDNAANVWHGTVRQSKRVGGWLWSAAVFTKDFVVDSAVGAWQFTAPFRGWIATPFRMAFGTTVGLTTLLVFGGKIVFSLAVIWGLYLLISGRMVMLEKRGEDGVSVTRTRRRWGNRVRETTITTRSGDLDEDLTPSTVNELHHQDIQVLTQAQTLALDARARDVRDRGERYADAGDENMISEYAGRLYLIEQRMAGSTESVNRLAQLHREGQESMLGAEAAQTLFVWARVKKGIAQEDKTVKSLMAQNALVDPVTEPA